MKLGAFFVLGGTLTLVGCSGSASGGSTSTPTPGVAATSVAVASTSTPPAVAPTAAIAAAGTHYQKGQAYLRSRDYKNAIVQFKAAVAAHQDVAVSYAGLGDSAVASGDYMTAYHAYRSAAVLQPRNSIYLYSTALAALYASENNAAVDFASRYMQLRPRDYNGYHLRYLAYTKLLRRAEQLADAKTEVRLRPQSADSYSDLGVALGNSGKYHDSENAFNRAIQINPGYFPYYTNRAMVENFNKKQSAALSDMQKAQSLATNSADKKRIALAIKNLKHYMATH